MIQTGYLLAFTTGLLGSFGHCLGMCGPVVAAYTLPGHAGPSRVFPHLMYHAGRISTYSFIGAVMGLTGAFANTAGRLAGFQQAAAVFTGVLMIIMGLGITGILRVNAFERYNGVVLSAVKVVAETDSPWKFLPLGLVLGFLPCGLSYSVFLGAAASGGLAEGMLYTLCFGAGTVPALLLFGVLIGYLSPRIRGWLSIGSGLAVIASGIYFLMKGILHD